MSRRCNTERRHHKDRAHRARVNIQAQHNKIDHYSLTTNKGKQSYTKSHLTSAITPSSHQIPSQNFNKQTFNQVPSCLPPSASPLVTLSTHSAFPPTPLPCSLTGAVSTRFSSRSSVFFSDGKPMHCKIEQTNSRSPPKIAPKIKKTVSPSLISTVAISEMVVACQTTAKKVRESVFL